MAFVLLAVLVGLLLPVQAGVNAQLRLALGHPLTTALVSFLVGTIALGILVLVTGVPVPGSRAVAQVPGWQWIGGLLGAVFAAAVILAPRLGAATMIASVVAGQMLASIVLDHFGWIGFPPHPVSGARVAGVALIVVGVVLLRK